MADGSTPIQPVPFERVAPPKLADVHVNRPLTDMSVAAIQSNGNFVANRIPVVRSKTKTNEYYKYVTDDMIRRQMSARAPYSAAAVGGFNYDTATYTIKRRSLAYLVDGDTHEQYDMPLDPDADATSFFDLQANLDMELELKDAMWANSIWTTNYAGVASSASTNEFIRWNVSGSTPIADIRTAMRAVALANGGIPANTIIMGKDVFDVLADHDDIIGRYSANGQGQGARELVTAAALAQLFNVSQVIVCQAVYNTAVEGATASNSYALSNGCWVGYIDYSGSKIKTASAIMRFVFTGRRESVDGFRMKKYYTDQTDTYAYELDADYTFKVTAASSGAFLRQVLSA